MTDNEPRPIPGFPGYWAYRDGRIERRTLLKGGRGNPDRYLRLSIRDAEGDLKTVKVHYLVALAFHGPRPKGLVIRHLNGNPLDNRATNLGYGTHGDNMQDRARHGTAARGTDQPNAKLTDRAVREIRTSDLGTAALASRYGVSETCIKQARKRHSWGHVK